MAEYRGTKSRAITSYDPRKKAIVAELKKRMECTKITNVRETREHYIGDGLNRDTTGRWQLVIGEFSIEKEFFSFESRSPNHE